MIRRKNETEVLLLSIPKNCEILSNKPKEKLKKRLILNLPNQEKHFISIRLLILVLIMIG